METPGFSPWIVLILVALLFLILWGGLFVFLAFGAWVIAKTRPPEEPPPPPADAEEWEAPRDSRGQR